MDTEKDPKEFIVELIDYDGCRYGYFGWKGLPDLINKDTFHYAYFTPNIDDAVHYTAKKAEEVAQQLLAIKAPSLNRVHRTAVVQLCCIRKNHFVKAQEAQIPQHRFPIGSLVEFKSGDTRLHVMDQCWGDNDEALYFLGVDKEILLHRVEETKLKLIQLPK